MHSIPVTRYLLPNGRELEDAFETERDDVKAKADQIIAAGFHFEFEVLMTGMGSFTVGDDNGDYVYVLVPESEKETLVPRVEQAIISADIETMKRQSEEANA